MNVKLLFATYTTDVFAVVTTEADGKGWRVAIYCDESVPLFGPSLPCPPVFEDPYNLREFLLVKLINGEKATFDTPTFSRKRERTLDALLRDMYQEHSQESKSNVSYFTRAAIVFFSSHPANFHLRYSQ